MSLLDKIKRFLNWQTPAKPKIDLNADLYEQLKPFRLPLILIVAMLMIGAMGYVFLVTSL